jgi:hypothetical protein
MEPLLPELGQGDEARASHVWVGKFSVPVGILDQLDAGCLIIRGQSGLETGLCGQLLCPGTWGVLGCMWHGSGANKGRTLYGLAAQIQLTERPKWTSPMSERGGPSGVMMASL